MPGKREREITYVPETKRTKGNGDRERIGSDRVLALVRLIRRLRLTLTLTPTQQRSKQRRWIRATHTDRPEMHTHTHSHTRTRTNTHAQRILWFYRQILNLLAAGLRVFSLFWLTEFWLFLIALLGMTQWRYLLIDICVCFSICICFWQATTRRRRGGSEGVRTRDRFLAN